MEGSVFNFKRSFVSLSGDFLRAFTKRHSKRKAMVSFVGVTPTLSKMAACRN